jgi:hypothetical protein
MATMTAPILSPEQVAATRRYPYTASMVLDLCASHARLYEAVRALPFISYDYVAMEIQESAENTDIPHRRPLLEEEAEAWRTLAAIRAEMEDGE